MKKNINLRRITQSTIQKVEQSQALMMSGELRRSGMNYTKNYRKEHLYEEL